MNGERISAAQQTIVRQTEALVELGRTLRVQQQQIGALERQVAALQTELATFRHKSLRARLRRLGLLRGR
jgi:hypothetical protein